MSEAPSGSLRVLVKEKISRAGIDLLKANFDVDVRTDMTDAELKERINEYDALIVRSATKVTADILEGSTRLKIIGRAGSGVDNIDVKMATKKGIVVANAPESNAVAAAEHAIALLMAQCRQIPQAYCSLKGGQVGTLEVRWGGTHGQNAGSHRARPHRHDRRAAGQGTAHGRHRV